MNKADTFFVENMTNILDKGESTMGQKVRPTYSDGTFAHTKYITDVFNTYDISKEEFPIITFRPVSWKSAIKEVLWIYQDASNNLDLLQDKYNITWWDNWDIGDRTIGQRYGATVKKYNLIDNLIKNLKEEPLSRRHVMNLFQYADFDETKGLYPCAYETVWSVRGDYLDLCLIQRSNDFAVANSINSIQYVALQMMIGKCVGLKPGRFSHLINNLHVYDRHTKQILEMLQRKPSDKQPILILKTNTTNFYDFTINDFEMIDYEPCLPQLKFDLGI